MTSDEFLSLLDEMVEIMGLDDRISAANEICRWHDAFSPDTVKMADLFLEENL